MTPVSTIRKELWTLIFLFWLLLLRKSSELSVRYFHSKISTCLHSAFSTEILITVILKKRIHLQTSLEKQSRILNFTANCLQVNYFWISAFKGGKILIHILYRSLRRQYPKKKTATSLSLTKVCINEKEFSFLELVVRSRSSGN